jgi:ATP synthase protein I
MLDEGDRLSDEFERRVEKQCERMEHARHEDRGSLWRYFGLMGFVGWSVAVPTALGALVGWWIDSAWETGSTWTFLLLMVGLATGCVNAWRAMTRERD